MAEEEYSELFEELYEAGQTGEFLEREYELDGVELTGFEFLSNLYGLAERERQFEEFYTTFRRAERRLSTGSFRQGTDRVEDAVKDFVDSANTYLGLNMEAEEFQADFTYLATVEDAAIPSNSEKIMEEISGSKGPISREEMREIIKEV